MKSKIDSFEDDYYYLSNFSLYNVDYEGIDYPSNEHAFQAAKTFDLDLRKEMSLIEDPSDVKKAGRRLRLRPDWELVKIPIMEQLVRRKFTIHKDLRQALIDTGDAELIEGNWWRDDFWGVYKGKGKNHLGIILMKIRDEVKNG